MRAVLTVFFLFLSSFAVGVEPLYALLACDTQSNLRSSILSNKAHMLDLLKTISVQAGLELHTTVLMGCDLTEAAIFDWIHEVQKSPRGVALFSYSGHGYRTQACVGSIPFLYFSKGRRTFRTDCFIREFEASGQRLAIMLLDCCNNANRLFQLEKFPPGRVAENLPGMKTLFLETEGTITFVGASPGGSSWYYYGTGGLFTSSFIWSILDETRVKEASWQKLFEQARRRCAPQQKPVCLLNISLASEKSHKVS